MLSNLELMKIISFLTSVTNYSKESLLKKNHNSLFNMYARIKQCMNTYPSKILSLQEKLNIKQYTLDDLSKMNYHELCSIKNILEKRIKHEENVEISDNEIEKEYIEPILISPDDLYISYLIDYHNYTDSELLDMGFIIVDKDHNTYLNYIRNQLKIRLINLILRKNSNFKYEMKSLEQLIDIYFELFLNKEDYIPIEDIIDEIKLEKR